MSELYNRGVGHLVFFALRYEFSSDFERRREWRLCVVY
jgi:hypothetical protein